MAERKKSTRRISASSSTHTDKTAIKPAGPIRKGRARVSVSTSASVPQAATTEAPSTIPAEKQEAPPEREREGTRRDASNVRLYTTPVGDVPSVTSVLSATKSIADIRGLERWKAKVGVDEAARITQEATQRGGSLHLAAEHYFRTGEPGSGPWWDSAAPFLTTRVTKPELIEARVWHPRGFGGSLDLCAIVDGEPAIIDYKTARKRKKLEWIHDYCLQVAAYVAGANHVYRVNAGREDRIRKGYIVVAYEDRPADVFELGPDALIAYYREFLARLDEFRRKRAGSRS